MGYMGDKSWWDKNFSQMGERLLNPEGVLVDKCDLFKNGSVLDLACGDGRNVVFLLEKSFHVTGVDFSKEALDRLRKFTDKLGYDVKTVQRDLNDREEILALGRFDNVLINHYRLNPNIYECMEEVIDDGGVLFVNGFGSKHKCDDRINEDDLILESDFRFLSSNFELIEYIERENEIGEFVTYIFRKKGD